MFPIRDDSPTFRFPFVVIALIALNAYILFRELILSPQDVQHFVDVYGLVPARDFASGVHWRGMFTSMFLHGGLLHLLMNMWAFWIFGDNVEGVLGHLRFLFFYLLCGLAAALTHSYLNPESTVPVVGASGAIAGIMGAYLVLFPGARIRMFTLLIFYPIFFDIPAFVFLIFWFLGQLLSGAGAAAQQAVGQDAGGIAFFAHVGGFVAGLVLVPFFRGRSIRKSRRGVLGL